MSRQNPKAKVYRLELVENETHKRLWDLKISRKWIWAYITVIVVVLVGAVYSLIAYTPIRTTIPGYPDAKTRRMAVQNAIKIDSLEMVVTRWEFYAENLSRVVDGRPALEPDSIARKAREVMSEKKLAEVQASDSLLRFQIAEEDRLDVTSLSSRRLPIEDMHFFSPLKGVISQGFEPSIHPYIEIAAPANSVIKSVLEGTVVFAGWSDGDGYTVQIQHQDNLISIYKHNQKLLHKVGDRVSAGAPIALLGSNGSLSGGDNLRFELWHEGEAIDPTRYISF